MTIEVECNIPANCQRQQNHVPCALGLAPVVLVVEVSKVVAFIFLACGSCSLSLAGQQRGVLICAPFLEHTLWYALDGNVRVWVGLLGVERGTMVGRVPRVRGLAVGGRGCAHGGRV